MLSKQMLPAVTGHGSCSGSSLQQGLFLPCTLAFFVQAHDIDTAGDTAQKCHKQPEGFLHSYRDLYSDEAGPMASLEKGISKRASMKQLGLVKDIFNIDRKHRG